MTITVAVNIKSLLSACSMGHFKGLNTLSVSVELVRGGGVAGKSYQDFCLEVHFCSVLRKFPGHKSKYLQILSLSVLKQLKQCL